MAMAPQLQKAALSSAASRFRLWLENLGIGDRISAILSRVLPPAYVEGWLVGQLSAKAVHTGVAPNWDTWRPGNPQAAQQIIDAGGTDAVLRHALETYNIRTIKSIADTRLDELARALASGVEAGLSQDRLARKLRDVLDIPSRAKMVAHTEIARAQSQASLNYYRRARVPQVQWLTAEDERVCDPCMSDESAGAIPTGQAFPTGHGAPPAHPLCRCALAPV